MIAEKVLLIRNLAKKYYGVSAKDIFDSSQRPTELVRARWLVIFYFWENEKASYSGIARALGMDHSSVAYAVKTATGDKQFMDEYLIFKKRANKNYEKHVKKNLAAN